MNTKNRLIKKVASYFSTIALCLGLTLVSTPSNASAAVLWFNYVDDLDSDYGVGYYADIDSLSMGTSDTDPDNITFLIYPYNAASSTFFMSGNGSLSFDINSDSIDDFVAYAPSTSLSAFSDATRQIVTGTNGLLNCYSRWSMTSDYGKYAVSIPWRCLGMPSQFRVEVWLSNSIGYDFLDYGPTFYPTFPTPTTTTTIYIPPAPTVPLVVPANTSTPGMVDNWIEYLVVKQAVKLTAVFNTTNCCYGAKSGTMKVLSKSRGSCVVRGKRIYPMKKGVCYIQVKAKVGNKTKTETLKFRVKSS